jgi:hypothetical protein
MNKTKSFVEVLRPLSQHARPAFTARGTCSVCGLTDVVCRDGISDSATHDPNQDDSMSCRKADTLTSRMEWLLVCAQCTMSGRG